MRGCVGRLESNGEGAASFISFRQTPCGAGRGLIMRSIVVGGEGGQSEKRAVFRKGEAWSIGWHRFREKTPGRTGNRVAPGSSTQTRRRQRAKLNRSAFPWRSVRRTPHHYACLFRRPRLEIPTSMPPPAPFGLPLRPAGLGRAHFPPIDRSAPRRTARLSFGVHSPDARTPTQPPPPATPLIATSYRRHCPSHSTNSLPIPCRPAMCRSCDSALHRPAQKKTHYLAVTELAGVGATIGWRHARSLIYKRSLIPNNRRPTKHALKVRMAGTRRSVSERLITVYGETTRERHNCDDCSSSQSPPRTLATPPHTS